jgi:hypothetical protein
MDVFANSWLGLQTALSLANPLYCFVGVFLSMAIDGPLVSPHRRPHLPFTRVPIARVSESDFSGETPALSEGTPERR